MAGIVATRVSIPGHLAMRYSLRIVGLLRPRGLPSVFAFATIVWLVCPGGSAMRRCINVDVRYRCLFDCRSNCRGTLTLPTSVGRPVDLANRVGTQCGADGLAADGGHLMFYVVEIAAVT